MRKIYTGQNSLLKYKPHLITIIIFLSGFAVSILISYMKQNEENNLIREQLTSRLDKLRSTLNLQLYSSINLTQGLIDLVKVQGGISSMQFMEMARECLMRDTKIRNIALAPGNIIKYMYPKEGNEKAIGLNYMNTPGQRETVLRAISEKNTVVAGPLELVQGGIGIISRTPIFFRDSSKNGITEKYWGIAAIVINFPKLIENTGIDKALNIQMIALRGIDGSGEKGRCFWGDSTIFFKDPVILDISLPSGIWQIAAVPINGWKEYQFFSYLSFYAGLLVSIAFSLLVFQVIRKNEILKYEINEHHKVEMVLRNTNQYTRSLIDANLDPLIAMTSGGIILDVNHATEIAIGREGSSIAGTEFTSYFTEPEKAEEVYRLANKNGSVKGLPLIMKNNTGQLFHVLFNASLYLREDGKKTAVLATARDITQLKLTENALKESEERYKFLADNMVDVVWILDINTSKFTYVSPSVEFLRGYSQEEVIKQSLNEVIAPTSLNIIFDLIHKIESGIITPDNVKFYVNEIEQIKKDGTNVWTEVITKLFKNEKTNHFEVYGVSRDITERKKSETERIRLQNLESLGVLAGGIAHDFNNILAVVLGRVSLAIDMEKEIRIKNSLLTVQKAIQRATALTQQLLTFSRGGRPQKLQIDIRKIITDTVKFALSGSNIKDEFEFDESFNLEADPGQISQVIQNITINAEQAMPDGGILTLKTKDFINYTGDKYIKISIIDTGIGISKEIMDKIFNPYFTTKNQGNGLGLSVCHSIIKKHGGYIEVKSIPDYGTTFDLYLPATERVKIEKETIRKGFSGKLKILIMDDEDDVREMLGSILKAYSSSIIESKDGNESVNIYSEEFDKGIPFDLVIMDLTIRGGMGGVEAAKLLLQTHPEAKIVVSSGYANDDAVDYKKFGFIGSLPKPYTISDVEEMLFNLFTKTE
jgi:PAS domain S-box-containing protein